jgi:hypothetical protein
MVEKKKIKDLTLQETIELMEECNRKGYEVHFEGNGDGSVGVVAEGLFIMPSGKLNNE